MKLCLLQNQGCINNKEKIQGSTYKNLRSDGRRLRGGTQSAKCEELSVVSISHKCSDC